MPPTKKTKKRQQQSELFPEGGGRETLSVSVQPRSEKQQEVVDLWPRSRILFLIGPAGTGKTHIGLALALAELTKKSERGKGKLMLTRPMVAVEESIGYLPGSVEEKVGAWLLPFHDVLGQITFTKWEALNESVEVESVPIGMLRGRTIRNGVLICDEMQNASYAQLKCVLTRLGEYGRIVISGDPDQSDLFSARESPLLKVASRLRELDVVCEVKFTLRDQVRDPLVSDILRLL